MVTVCFCAVISQRQRAARKVSNRDLANRNVVGCEMTIHKIRRPLLTLQASECFEILQTYDYSAYLLCGGSKRPHFFVFTEGEDGSRGKRQVTLVFVSSWENGRVVELEL